MNPMSHRRVAVWFTVVVACLALGACSGGKKKTDPTTPSAPSSSSTTAGAAGPVAPLTGLPLADDGIRNRPLLVVKVDNHPEARPQFGIDRADVMVEEKVEGGLSRFMALFHSQDVDRVGPVRSLRSTDPKWLQPEGGMIAYSGGIDPVKRLLPQYGIVDLGADNHGTTYYKRRGDRSFEHGMYTITPVLRTLSPPGLPAAKPLFPYLAAGEKFGGAGAAPVSSVSLRMDGSPTATSFDWTWNAEKAAFLRGTDGRPHEIEGVGQIAMKNVIVQFTPYRGTPWRDRANSVVDEAVVAGSGDAWFLSDGTIVRGKWSRPTEGQLTTYTDASGAPMKFAPGQSWISLVPPGHFAEAK